MLVKPQHKHGPKAEMNVVPYIDVMLVLLVIFMVTAPMLTQGVKIELPKFAAEAMAPGAFMLWLGLAATVVRVLARQTLGVIADVAEIDEGAASPALLGLLRYASGVLPSNAEAMALRIAGLADLKGGMLLLTPPAKAILFTHGFQLRDPLGMAMETEVPAEEAVSTAFVAMARLRIGEVHHDIARCDATDQMAFRITGTADFPSSATRHRSGGLLESEGRPDLDQRCDEMLDIGIGMQRRRGDP